MPINRNWATNTSRVAVRIKTIKYFPSISHSPIEQTEQLTWVIPGQLPSPRPQYLPTCPFISGLDRRLCQQKVTNQPQGMNLNQDRRSGLPLSA
jgi:hypothetical protein